MNKSFLYPSFDTIAGSGKNGAIVHYRAQKENCRNINKKDIFLCDSGGQYKYGTTDVTRTICFTNQAKKIKNIFTKVLKGHIAVATTNINKDNTGPIYIPKKGDVFPIHEQTNWRFLLPIILMEGNSAKLVNGDTVAVKTQHLRIDEIAELDLQLIKSSLKS